MSLLGTSLCVQDGFCLFQLLRCMPVLQPRSHTHALSRGQWQHSSKCARRTETAVGFVPRTERSKWTAWHGSTPASPCFCNLGRELQRERGQWNSAEAFSLLIKRRAPVCLRVVSWDATVSLVSCPFAHKTWKASRAGSVIIFLAWQRLAGGAELICSPLST